MEIIETRIETHSPEYEENYHHMEGLVARLEGELKKAREERSPRALARLKEQGKLSVRQRLEHLLDKNTPFLEIAPLAAYDLYDKKVHSAGIVAGIGIVEGKEMIIHANDPLIKGGTIYPMGVKKGLRIQTIAMENRLPIVNLVDSGGAYLPLQSEIFPDSDDGGRIFYNQAIISKMGIPQICGVMGLCTAGGAYIPAMSDEVVHVKDTGAIFLGGPPLVLAATGEEVTADELGGAMVHCRQSGVSDYFAEDDAHCLEIIRQIVKNLPPAKKTDIGQRRPSPPLYDPKEIYGIVPTKLSIPYDCREVIARMVDGSEFLEADEAVFLGPSEPSQSYLNRDLLIKAAQKTGAQAIHPGYGFLAENADFAEACQKAGVVFIGPPGPVIRNLGNKTVARRIMAEAGVPVIPGMLKTATDPKILAGEAEKIGYPVIIKAEAGGGGKGMRIVVDRTALEEACFSCQSEAEKAFGHGALYLEKHLESPRHIEFQILADSQGNVVHLFERECSIQRRHQKIIEETPSPMMTPELRLQMGQAAVAAARASGYINAGTVEFLLDRAENFYFLEVNTRLQVEHPITEMTTGLDLVREQLMIAAGEPLSFRQEDLCQQGHAIECRIYAEDPEAQFFPSPGRILFYHEPSGPGVRNDTGIYSGFEIPEEYDPILSKLMAHGQDRKAARQRLIRALQNYCILGIRTTIPFLVDVLNSPAFAEGETTTDFIDRHFMDWKQDKTSSHLAAIVFALDELAGPGIAPNRIVRKGWPSPWETLGPWRL